MPINTKYRLCSNINQGLSLNAEIQPSADNEEFFIYHDGKIYNSIEEFDANEMPRELIMNKPNVVVAYAGTKISKGVDTGEPCVVVGVTKKLKREELSEKDMIPPVLPDGVITDVVEFPPILAFSTCTGGGAEGCFPHNSKHRPLIGGISAVEETATACTLALIVKDSTNNRLVTLTTNHCAGLLYDPSFKTPTYGSLVVSGKKMVQPSPSDGGGSGDIYGTVIRAVAMQFGTDSGQNNIVDCSIASIDSVDNMSTSILDMGTGPFPFASKNEYSVGTQVYKSGRTTGFTPPPTTTILSTAANVNVYYGPPGGSNDKDYAPFSNQILYSSSSRFTQGGDSGSAILAIINGQYKVIGLHFAGNSAGTTGVANHIQDVASLLNIEAWNGDIVVAYNTSPCIKVNGVCYERVGDTTEDITHTVDAEYSSCEECESGTNYSSSSSSSSSQTVSTTSSVSSSSSESYSSESYSSKSSSSTSSSTHLMTSSESSQVSGSSSSSVFEELFVKQVPRRFTVEISNNNEIVLRWVALKNVTGYSIERKEGFSDWVELGETPFTYYADKDVVPGKYYQYRIRGYINV